MASSMYQQWTQGEGGQYWAQQHTNLRKKYGNAIDTLAKSMASYAGAQVGQGEAWKDAVTFAMAQLGGPPEDRVERKAWAKNVMLVAGQMARASDRAVWENKAGHKWGEGTLKGEALTAYQDESVKDWGTMPALTAQDFNTLTDEKSLEGLADTIMYAADEDPSLITGNEGDGSGGGDDPTTRLKAYYDALYNHSTASQIAAMAGGQARRSQRGRGLRGGLSDLAAAGAVNRGLEGYAAQTNDQALRYMGMDQGVMMQEAALRQQAGMYNADLMNRYMQDQFNRRSQMGGMVGGITGGLIGAVAQYAGLPGGAQLGTALGTGIGSAAGGGQAPGIYQYQYKPSGSIKKPGGGGGSSSGNMNY